jgi:hypothetical protein
MSQGSWVTYITGPSQCGVPEARRSLIKLDIQLMRGQGLTEHQGKDDILVQTFQ